MPILNSPTLSGDISGSVYATRLEKLKGYPISTATPVINQALVFDGSQWSPSNVSSSGSGGSIAAATELIAATAGQTVFNLSTISYVPNANNLAVYSNGIRLIKQQDYTETNSTTVTLTLSVEPNTEMLFEAGKILSEPLVNTVNTQFVAATAGQTVFNLSTISYVPNTNNLAVYSNGLKLIPVTDYTETNSNRVTLVSSVEAGTEMVFEAGRILSEPLVNIVNTQFVTATANQNVFDLSAISYVPNTNNLAVYSNGLKLIPVVDYVETNSNRVTLVSSVEAGTEMVFEAGRVITQTIQTQGTTGTFTVSVSAPALSGTFFGDGSRLTGVGGTYTPPANATFTSSVSAPALSGTHFGDGSRLTGVIATDSTKLPTAGGSITGSLTVANNLGVGTASPASPMHVIGNSRLQGDVTITGNLSCAGTQTFFNTLFSTTSAVSVVNTGPGVALYVGNIGPGDIASFYDIDQNIEVLHVGGNNGTFPNVGIKTSTPNKTFTVNGEISATQDITTSSNINAVAGTFFSSVSAPALSGTHFGDGSRLTGISTYTPPANATFTSSVSAPALSGTFFGDGSRLTGVGGTYTPPANATFTSSVSAPALSGTFFGDGSRLTGISTYTPPANATFTSSVSAPALSGTFFGDGSRLTGVTVAVQGGTITGRLDLLTTSETKSTPSISLSALNLDLAAATFFSVSLNSNITTLAFSNIPPSPRVFSFMLQLVGDGSARVINWPSSVRWGGGIQPILTSSLNKVDTLSFLTHDGGINWFGFIVDQNS